MIQNSYVLDQATKVIADQSWLALSLRLYNGKVP